jgi:hypothetical protein
MRSPRCKLIDSVVTLAQGDVLVAGGGPQAELYEYPTGRFRTVLGDLGATPSVPQGGGVGRQPGAAGRRLRRADQATAQAWLFTAS